VQFVGGIAVSGSSYPTHCIATCYDGFRWLYFPCAHPTARCVFAVDNLWRHQDLLAVTLYAGREGLTCSYTHQRSPPVNPSPTILQSPFQRNLPAVDSHGLARRFGTQWVLRGVTLSVQPGECVGILGANGSGKSTLLRILGTLLRPNVGTASIYGRDVVREAEEVRRLIGSLSHLPGLYDDLTARENLIFAAAMLGIGDASIPGVLERVGLLHVAEERVRGFSAGMQRRLSLARLLLHSPKLLLMDEPYSNLDSAGVKVINSAIADVINSGGAAVVVLHEVAPAISVLNRCIRIEDGRASDVASHPVGMVERSEQLHGQSVGGV